MLGLVNVEKVSLVKIYEKLRGISISIGNSAGAYKDVNILTTYSNLNYTSKKLTVPFKKSYHFIVYRCENYRVRHNYGNQGLMERYKFNSQSAINLTRD